MVGSASAIQIQDKLTQLKSSVVQTTADVTKNGLVIVNPDGSKIGTGAINSFGITLDGQGGVITTGIKGDWIVPYACTITGWTVLGDVSGSIVIDTWKDTYVNYPPTITDTMRGTKPNLTGAIKNQTNGLSIAVTAGDIIRYNVDSCATCTRVLLSFNVAKL